MRTVLFVQLPPPRFSFRDPPTNIHLAAGFVSAALDVRLGREISTHIIPPHVVDIYADQGLADAIVAMRPDFVAMTLYVWNVQRSLLLALRVKRALPRTKILLGGPEVTPDNEWVIKHPAADAGVFGEGESRIADVVGMMLSPLGDKDIPGVFFRETECLRINRAHAAPWDLASTNYPYLDGKIGPSRDGTLFLEAIRGCPYRCRYCYYHKALGGIRSHPSESIRKVLDFAYGSKSGVREIYLMDPTFNAGPVFRDMLISMAQRSQSRDIALHAELRADLLDSEDVALLRSAGLVSAEVGLQSVNKEALRLAGRTGAPARVAHGVSLLKQEGIDVTTGIIIGLPGDTPEGFRKTLDWLEQTHAYSVVHPFVLSVLPGTDFRENASRLGLVYDARPPYYVRSTHTFPAGEIRAALINCERVFDMEFDHIGYPSFVDHGVAVATSPDDLEYISKWIVNPETNLSVRQLPTVVSRASDPFTFWFRGRSTAWDEGPIVSMLAEFADANPHAFIRVILEFDQPPPLGLLRKIIESAGYPSIFLNRSFQPFLAEGEVVSPDLTLLLPYGSDPALRDEILCRYEPLAGVVWTVRNHELALLRELTRPLLVSSEACTDLVGEQRFPESLIQVSKDYEEEIFFRDATLQEAWSISRNGRSDACRLEETILMTME